jgi:3,4-dihydroxy-2-butanone 4-phosphate synthase
VLDTLVSQLHPSFSPSSSEHKQDGRSSFPSSPILLGDEEDVMVRVRRALAAIRRGEFVVVVDSADRENEGDLIMDAALVTAERIAYMVNETSGLICVGLSAKRAAALSLPAMVERNTESHGTAFTVSVDCNVGTTSGISAADRAITIRALADDASLPSSFNRPGHVFPLIAKDGGVLQRPGHTEASVELSRLSGGQGVGVMCEIVRRDGAMMRPGELRDWSRRQGWEIVSIADIIAFRETTEGQQTDQ